MRRNARGGGTMKIAGKLVGEHRPRPGQYLAHQHCGPAT